MLASDYLHRLGGARSGLERSQSGAPDVELLFRLHAAHVERVPYENLDIWLGRRTTIDPEDSWRRIVRGRGGYCFHLNGAFSLLLRRLGFRVVRHIGGVRGTRDDDIAEAMGNHLTLTVSGLPTDANPGGRWLVDVGLGNGLHHPLPLVEGVHEQGPFRYGLRRSPSQPGGWVLEHDPKGSFATMEFLPEATDMPAFAARHEHLWTSPESPFVRVATAQRRDAAGADVLTGLVLKRIGSADVTGTAGSGDGGRARRSADDTVTLDRPADYFAALADVFGLTLDDVSPAEKAGLWARLTAAHERWQAERSTSITAGEQGTARAFS